MFMCKFDKYVGALLRVTHGVEKLTPELKALALSEHIKVRTAELKFFKLMQVLLHADDRLRRHSALLCLARSLSQVGLAQSHGRDSMLHLETFAFILSCSKPWKR